MQKNISALYYQEHMLCFTKDRRFIKSHMPVSIDIYITVQCLNARWSSVYTESDLTDGEIPILCFLRIPSMTARIINIAKDMIEMFLPSLNPGVTKVKSILCLPAGTLRSIMPPESINSVFSPSIVTIQPFSSGTEK